MQVLKKVGAKLQARIVQPSLVEHWTHRIRSLSKDIARINEVRNSALVQDMSLHTPFVTSLLSSSIAPTSLPQAVFHSALSILMWVTAAFVGRERRDGA